MFLRPNLCERTALLFFQSPFSGDPKCFQRKDIISLLVILSFNLHFQEILNFSHTILLSTEIAINPFQSPFSGDPKFFEQLTLYR